LIYIFTPIFLYLPNKGHIALAVHSWDLHVENISNLALIYHVENFETAITSAAVTQDSKTVNALSY